MHVVLFAPVTLALLAFIGWVVVLAHRHVRQSRWAFGLGPLVEVARALGAIGPDPDRRGDGPTLTVDGRRFSLVAGAWGKHRPIELLLGTDVRQAASAANASAFRTAPASAAPLRSMPRMVFRRETALDRWGKRLGLNRELQAGDATFDRAVYVEHEGDAAAVAAAIDSPGVTAAVNAALASAPDVVTNTHSQAVALRWRSGAAPATPQELLEAMARLDAIARALPPVVSLELRRRPWFPGAAGRVAVVGGILVVGVGVAAAAALVGGAGPVDGALLHHAAALTAALLLLALVAGWLVSRARPRGFARFGAIALAAMSLASPLALGGLGLANATSVTGRHTVEASVASMDRIRKRQRSPRCSVELVPWREDLVERPRGPVPCALLPALAVGDRVTVSMARGRLGYAWIEGITPLR